MPLDGHSYLVAQGWGGNGTGLRQGSISRPLAIPQKRTLAGLGKDRDEAFPFWDHLFSSAAKSIQVKIAGDGSSDDTSDSDDEASSSQHTLKRTSTGLLSNRRPTHGAPASSGTATPTMSDADANANVPPRLSLLATAKREAAKRSLYARFLRGPVVAPVSDIEVIVSQCESVSTSHSGDSPGQNGSGSVEGRTKEKKENKRDKVGKATKEVLEENGKDERSRKKKEKRDRKTKEKEKGDDKTRVEEKRHKEGKDKKEKEKKRKRTTTTVVEERERTGDSDADKNGDGTITLADDRPKKKRKPSHRSDVGNEGGREKTKVKAAAAAAGTVRELGGTDDFGKGVQVELGDLGHEKVTKKRKKEKLHIQDGCSVAR